MNDLDRLSPRDAVGEMILAGARFTIRHRDDALGWSFSYSLEPGADRERCRAILASAKERPAPYFTAFKIEVQRAASAAETQR